MATETGSSANSAEPSSPQQQQLSVSTDLNLIEAGITFQRLDDLRVYRQTVGAVLQPTTENIAFKFCNESCYVAANLSAEQVKLWLEYSDPKEAIADRVKWTRWICVLGAEKNVDVISSLSNHFHLSPRHRSSLTGELHWNIVKHVWHWGVTEFGKQFTCVGLNGLHPQPEFEDEHGALTRSHTDAQDGPTFTEKSRRLRDFLNFLGLEYNVPQSKRPSRLEADRLLLDSLRRKMAPQGVGRTWSWIFMCDERTVWSIHEDVFQPIQAAEAGTTRSPATAVVAGLASQLGGGSMGVASPATATNTHRVADHLIHNHTKSLSPRSKNDGEVRNRRLSIGRSASPSRAATAPARPPDVGAYEKAKVKSYRGNLLNVITALSAFHSRSEGDIATDLPFRDASSDPSTFPSLLLYYLIEDQAFAIEFLELKKPHRFSVRLNKLRGDIIRDPSEEHLRELHNLAMELSTLKRVYETYTLVVDRILQRQPGTIGGSTPNPASASDASLPTALSNITASAMSRGGLQGRSFTGTLSPIPRPESYLSSPPAEDLGIRLDPLARAKFERLRDRISLYALAEVIDCIVEKDALVQMLFNRLALRESQSLDRLGRITTFLTKFTVFFLPLSLLTGFFSMQVPDLSDKFSTKIFWATTGSVVAIMLIFVLLVGSTEKLMVLKLAKQAKGEQRRAKKSGDVEDGEDRSRGEKGSSSSS